MQSGFLSKARWQILIGVTCMLGILSQQSLAVSSPNLPPLNPALGQEIGQIYEAFLSPQQEPDEEKNTPNMTPKEFLSTAPSLLRDDRKSRGHGRVAFRKDLSRAFVELKIENIKPEDIVMLHIHCGKPDMLGPILVDFAQLGSLQAQFKQGVLVAEVNNHLIEKTAHAGHSPISTFTAGCPIDPDNMALGKVRTIAGMAQIARQGELYFNLHTKGQTFFGDIRGQLYPLK